MVRTVLAVLETITGLDSVYLTRVDDERHTQQVVFRSKDPLRAPGDVRESGGAMERYPLPAGHPRTTCLTPSTPTNSGGDLPGVKAMSIRTYLSEPVRDKAGQLMGTLCAISDRRVPITADTLHAVGLFARLIAHHLECSSTVAQLKADNESLESRLTIDPLTGIANRRGLLAELARSLAHASREDARVVVAFIDLDRFKTINDLYGHTVGDHFLVAVAARLTAATRAGEVLARYGGDEFVIVASFAGAPGEPGLQRLAERFALASRGRFMLGEHKLDYAGASVGTAVATPGEDATALLHRADQAMYTVKESRRPKLVAKPGARG